MTSLNYISTSYLTNPVRAVIALSAYEPYVKKTIWRKWSGCSLYLLALLLSSTISDSPSVLVKEERVPSPAVSPPTSSAINDRCSPIGITSTPLAASAAAHSDSATTPVHMSVITSSPAKQQQPSQTASQLLPQVETPSFGDSFAPLIATTANVTTTGTNSANHASSATAQTPAPPKKQHSATPLLKANYQAALQKSPPFGTSGGALANASTGVGSSTSAVTSPSAAQAFAQVRS